MANFLTNLLFEPKGKHDPNKTYTIKDTVMSADASKVYFALKDVPAGISLDNTDYWILQMDLSVSKNAMDVAAANARTQTDATIASANTRVEDMMGKAAEAVTSVADYAAKVGMRVKGETKITKGNPMTIYPDGGSLLKVQTDIPIKQLGSGDPYPAGGGKNLIKLIETAGNASKDNNTVIFGSVGDSYFFITADGIQVGELLTLSFDANNFTGEFTLDIHNEDGYVMSVKPNARNTITFSYMNKSVHKGKIIVDDRKRTATNIILSNIQLEKGTTASPYEPYSNIRPFVGYDELGLSVAGKNLLKNTATSNTNNGVTFTVNEDGSVTASGTATENEFLGVNGGFVLPAGEYILNGCESVNASAHRLYLYYDGKTIDNVSGDTLFTLEENKKLQAYIIVVKGATVNTIYKPMIRLASDPDATYEPYAGTLYTVQLGETTYQGHYDWMTGKFRAEWVARSFDGTNDNWRVTQYSNLCAWVDVPELVWSSTFYSSHFKCYNSITDESDGTIGVAIEGATSVSFGLFFGIKGIASTVDEWESFLSAQYAAGTPVQVAYKLATPIEMQLAPNVITAVEDGGVNYIYGDADLTVEWVKPLETSLTEHSNAKVDANNEALLMDVAQKERSIGNPVVINDAVANVAFPHVETVFMPKQAGGGDPYPAGGGRNKLEVTSSNQDVNGVVKTINPDGSVTISGTCNKDFGATVNYSLFLPDGDYKLVGGANGYRLQIWGNDNSNTSKFITLSANGSSATFTADSSKYISYIVQYEVLNGKVCNDTLYPMILLASDAVETFAPYENIRHISGWDKLELNHAGKNLYNKTAYPFARYRENIPSASRTPPIFIKAGTYTFTGANDFGNNYIKEYATYDDAANDTNRYIEYIFVESKTITFTKDVYIRLQTNDLPEPYNYDAVSNQWQIERGSVATDFAMPVGTLHTVQIGETVYGGRYNWLTGKLVAEWSSVALRDLTMSYKGGDHKYFEINMPTDALATADFLCESYKNVGVLYYSAMPSTPTGCMGYYSQDRVWRLKDTRYTSINELFTGNGDMKIAYKLSTPIEIQLDPTRITTIPGTNTIFGDGEFTIDWFKSYKKVAEERENLLLDSFTDKAELSGNPIALTPVGGLPFDSVVTEFAPKQSGSGDPYPAGGGKNLFNPQQNGLVLRGTTIDGDVLTTEFATGALYIQTTDVYPAGTYTISVIPISDDIGCSLWFYDANDNSETFGTAFSKSKNSYTFTKDAPFHFGIGGISAALGTFRYKIQLEAGSTVTPYAPYSNIRPFIGYDKLDLNRAGKNLFPVPVLSSTGSGNIYTKDKPFNLPAGQYTLSFKSANVTTTDMSLALYAGETVVKPTQVLAGETRVTFTLGTPADGLVWYVREAVELTEIQLEAGSYASDFQPYVGTLHTVQIGQTVYGGRFDWLTGKLVADVALLTLTDNESIVRVGAKQFAITPQVSVLNTKYNVNDALCSHFPYNPTSYGSNANGIVTNNGHIIIRYNGLAEDTNDAFKTYLAAQYTAGTPVQVAYKLATPIEIQLTPGEIIALSGVNTLYGDGDTITAKFRQSKTISLEERLSALEAVFLNQ